MTLYKIQSQNCKVFVNFDECFSFKLNKLTQIIIKNLHIKLKIKNKKRIDKIPKNVFSGFYQG